MKFVSSIVAIGLAFVAWSLPDFAVAACSTPTANVGALDFQGGSFKYCDGTNWLSMGAAGPWAVAGSTISYSSGRVGIGSTSPTSRFEVQDSTTAGTGIYQTIQSQMYIQPPAASDTFGRAVVGSVGYGGVDSSAGATIVGVDAVAGNWGTGLVGTVHGARGLAYLTSTGVISEGAGGYFSTQTGSGTITNAMGVKIGTIQGTNKWSIYASDATAPSHFAGNVGIGTTSPQLNLDIWAAGSTVARVLNTSTGSAQYPGFIAQNYMGATNTGYPMNQFINSRGTVGSPTAVLAGDVLGLFSARGSYTAGYSTYESGQIMFSADQNFSTGNGGGAIRFSTTTNGATTVSEKMRITNAGFVGIGTTNPSYKLSVANNATAFSPQVALSNGDTGNQSYAQMAFVGSGRTWSTGVGNSTETVFGLANKYFIYDSDANAVRMVIASSGNVGIGTNDPKSTLQVNGSIARNIVTVTGATYTLLATDTHVIVNRGGGVTLTLPSAASFPGREISIRTIQANAVSSASANVVPLLGGAAGTTILSATDGKWVLLVSDGTEWQVQMGN